MTTFFIILRITFIVLASLVALVYILAQFYQKVSTKKIAFTTKDYVVFFTVSFIFGFGTNSYFGLLVFLPLLLISVLCQFWVRPEKIRGSGYWIEVHWKKLTPKGFGSKIPAFMLQELNKIPKDTHFVIPHLYFSIAIRFIRYKMKSTPGQMPKGVSLNQQQFAMGQFHEIIERMALMGPGMTEKKDFPFGVLRVSRL